MAPPQSGAGQSAALAVFLIIILIQSPLFVLIPLDESEMTIPMSPIQGACVSLVTFNPALKPVTQGLLMSGTFYRVLVKEVYACFNGQDCDTSRIFNFKSLWEQSDVSRLTEVFRHSFKANAPWAATACALICISSFSLAVAPGKGLMGLIGMGQLFYCLMSESATSQALSPLYMLCALLGFATWMESPWMKKKALAMAKPSAEAVAEPASPAGPVKKKSRT